MASVLAIMAAVLVAYAKQQIREGIIWLLAPITELLPWNKPRDPSTNSEVELSSEFSLVDLFLLDSEGKSARYQKTTSFVANGLEASSYQEGVTAEGFVVSLSTMRGSMVQGALEHGFYLCRIELPDAFPQGAHFTNVFCAELHDSFNNSQEHWTQEIAFPTRHLTLQIHFPVARPPLAVRCKAVQGTTDRPLRTAANIVELFGRKSIVWEIEHPKLGDIFKLEWRW